MSEARQRFPEQRKLGMRAGIRKHGGFKTGLLDLGFGLFSWIILCGGAVHPVCRGMHTSVPGVFPLAAQWHLPQLEQYKVFPGIAKCPLMAKALPVEIHRFTRMTSVAKLLHLVMVN